MHLLPTEKSLQIFYWLNEDDGPQGQEKQKLFTSRNEKRDVDSKSASLISLPVIPSNEIPAINLNGVPFATIAGKRQAHDSISIPEITEQGIISEIAPLYASGHSIPEISKMTGIAKTSVRDLLARDGISLRASTHSPRYAKQRKSGRVRWNSPYGFHYAKGQLVPHPQEFETLRLILKWSKAVQSYQEIAEALNSRKLRPRAAKAWNRFTVRQIVRWHAERPEVLRSIVTRKQSTFDETST